MRLVLGCLILGILGFFASPRLMPDENVAVGGIWCDHVSAGNGCPPPEIWNGWQLQAACAALPVSTARGAWAFELQTVLASSDNCDQQSVGAWNCGTLTLASAQVCDPHRAYVPIF